MVNQNSANIMATIKIQQVRSIIRCPQVQKDTMAALGLRKMNAIVEHEATPAILGMVEKVKHLVKVID
jgi:large subunit ribosomal protein L30